MSGEGGEVGLEKADTRGTEFHYLTGKYDGDLDRRNGPD